MPPAPVKEVAPNKTIALLGQPVTGPLGQEVGHVVDVLVDGKGAPQAAVIDFGGFLGVGTRKIAVQWNTLHFNPGDKKYPVVLDLLPEQIKAAPNYKGEAQPAPVVAPPWEAPSKPEPNTAEAAAQPHAKLESPAAAPPAPKPETEAVVTRAPSSTSTPAGQPVAPSRPATAAEGQ